MKLINLANGGVTLVDDRDFPAISKFKWYGSNGYAARYVRNGKWDYGSQRLHREILDLKDKSIGVDHINGNPLDNRRSNLRVVDQRVNSLNSRCRTKTKKYQGVYFKAHHKFNKWAVRIVIDRRDIWFGCFPTAAEAHKAYEHFRLELIYGLLHG